MQKKRQEIRNRESISNLSVQRDELPIRRAAAREDTRFEEPEQSLEAINIRVLTRNKQLSHDDAVSVIMPYPKLRRLRKNGLAILANVLRGFEEVQAGRSNVIDFLHRTRGETMMICSELCSLFYSMKNDFSAVGIDTEEQRVSFFFRVKCNHWDP
ncbi:hypothetical protein PI125_g16599 [Phytophthora idaei]|nr:hypothetical protein PI125_g16599 [Phytophthora idaei]